MAATPLLPSIAVGMLDDEGEVYAWSDDRGSDVDYAYESNYVCLGAWEKMMGVDRGGDAVLLLSL